MKQLIKLVWPYVWVYNPVLLSPAVRGLFTVATSNPETDVSTTPTYVGTYKTRNEEMGNKKWGNEENEEMGWKWSSGTLALIDSLC